MWKGVDGRNLNNRISEAAPILRSNSHHRVSLVRTPTVVVTAFPEMLENRKFERVFSCVTKMAGVSG